MYIHTLVTGFVDELHPAAYDELVTRTPRKIAWNSCQSYSTLANPEKLIKTMDPTQRYLWHRQIWKSDQFRCNWLHVPALLLILYHCTPLCDTFCSSNLSLPFPPPKELLLTWLPLPLLRLPMQTRYVYAFILLFDIFLTTNMIDYFERVCWFRHHHPADWKEATQTRIPVQCYGCW